MSKKVKPLLIVKLNCIEPAEAVAKNMAEIAEGIRQGALVLGPECDVIAFDQDGNCVYPK